jgi:hypothetical protein
LIKIGNSELVNWRKRMGIENIPLLKLYGNINSFGNICYEAIGNLKGHFRQKYLNSIKIIKLFIL